MPVCGSANWEAIALVLAALAPSRRFSIFATSTIHRLSPEIEMKRSPFAAWCVMARRCRSATSRTSTKPELIFGHPGTVAGIWRRVVFAEFAQDSLGFELYWVQCGVDPKDWKPMPAIGTGVKEIRVRDESGIFRMIYLATRPEGVYVLHCFQKEAPKGRVVRIWVWR